MSYTTVPPERARELLERDGWTYIDVRSEQEFERGHPAGAYNVPLAQMSPSGMTPNPSFVEVIKRHFAVDARLVVGCAAGGRSARACDLLAAEGYANLVNMHGGFSGARDATGAISEPGWQAQGYPTGSGKPAQHCYRDLCAQ